MNEMANKNLIDRTLWSLRRAWRDVAGAAKDGDLTRVLHSDLPDADQDLVRQRIALCLSAKGGEVSARGRAADLGRGYLSLNATGRERFLNIVARELGTDRKAVDIAVEAYRTAENDDERAQAEDELRLALESPRKRLFTQFNALPEGIKFLVEMRADLLPLIRKDPALADMDRDLKDLLTSWFDIGFLNLSRIHWQSSAALLEKLIAYEAVHQIQSWDDLKNRLDSDRRCFAFFHPRMPDEPLIFVEVALVTGISDNIHALLDEAAPPQDPHKADTAIFYSISNCQRGLAGVSFGDFLIKRVVDDLAGHFHNLKNFATLSPIPGFRKWLAEASPELVGGLLKPAEADRLKQLSKAADPAAAIQTVLASKGWFENEAATAALEPPLLRLCAHYLLKEKRRDTAKDRVAHFHLSNGARVERINWLGNLSPIGLEQSAGMMVNYRYKLEEIESNHEAYRGSGRIAASTAVRRLLRP